MNLKQNPTPWGCNLQGAAVCDLLSPLIRVGFSILSSVSVIKLTKTFLRASPSVPVSSLDTRKFSYRCVPSSSRLSNFYHLLHNLFYVRVSPPQHEPHFGLENSFFFLQGLSCFYRMFSPISGLYLLNASSALYLKQIASSTNLS